MKIFKILTFTRFSIESVNPTASNAIVDMIVSYLGLFTSQLEHLSL